MGCEDRLTHQLAWLVQQSSCCISVPTCPSWHTSVQGSKCPWPPDPGPHSNSSDPEYPHRLGRLISLPAPKPQTLTHLLVKHLTQKSPAVPAGWFKVNGVRRWEREARQGNFAMATWGRAVIGGFGGGRVADNGFGCGHLAANE